MQLVELKIIFRDGFFVDEYIQLDREDAPYAESIAELDEICAFELNSVLSLRLTGDNDEEIKDKLSKRYRNQLSQVLKTMREIFSDIFVNSSEDCRPAYRLFFSQRF